MSTGKSPESFDGFEIEEEDIPEQNGDEGDIRENGRSPRFHRRRREQICYETEQIDDMMRSQGEHRCEWKEVRVLHSASSLWLVPQKR